MKKYMFILMLLFPILLTAQTPKWEAIFGIQNWNEYPEAIIEINDGGIYISGYAEKFASTTWAIKTDVNGEMLYDKEVNHEQYELSTGAIAKDSSGNTFIGGTFYPGNDYLPFVIKLDPCGELLWCKHFALASNSIGGFTGDIILNHNNELVILMTYSTGDHDDQIYLGCLDENGNELWFDSYARKEDYPLLVNPVAWDLLEHNNKYYIAGYGYYPYHGNPNHVYLRPLFIGVDSLFNEMFVTPYYAMDSVFGEARALISLNDSTLLGIGYKYLDEELFNTIIMRISTSGEELGYSQISNQSFGNEIDYNVIREICSFDDSLFFSPVYMGINGEERFGELVYDKEGNIFKNSIRGIYKSDCKSLKTQEKKFVMSVAIGEDDNTDILLYKIDENLQSVPFDTTLHLYDSLCPHTIQSGILDLTNCLVITSIEDWATPDQYYESIRWIPIKAYPNPVKDGRLTLEFENTEHHQNMELCCYDSYGRQVHSQKIYKGQQDKDVDVSAWPAGIYVAVVYSNGGARGKVKFVVE